MAQGCAQSTPTVRSRENDYAKCFAALKWDLQFEISLLYSRKHDASAALRVPTDDNPSL